MINALSFRPHLTSSNPAFGCSRYPTTGLVYEEELSVRQLTRLPGARTGKLLVPVSTSQHNRFSRLA